MHIPDGFIDLPVSVAAAAVAVPTVALATRRSGHQLAEREIPLAGLVVAYLVVAQLLVFPVGLGTSAHLIGTGLALVLVGPWVTSACVAIVLVLQSLLFADGGISALGLNYVNNGLVPVLVGWAVLTLVLGRVRSGSPGPDAPRSGHRSGHRRVVVASGLAAGLGAFAGAIAFTVEYALGRTGEAPVALITTGFLGAHVVVALLEGVLTALLVAALLRTRPDLVLRWRRIQSVDDEPAFVP